MLLEGKMVVSGILKLIEPNDVPWNSEQLWHLFKYASNALTYVVPKIPSEFIEHDGPSRYILHAKFFFYVMSDRS